MDFFYKITQNVFLPKWAAGWASTKFDGPVLSWTYILRARMSLGWKNIKHIGPGPGLDLV